MRIEDGVLLEVNDSDINLDGSFTFPEGVTSVGVWAFNCSSKIKGIRIPKGVTSIKSWAFADCNSLTEINIPKGITSIGAEAFSRTKFSKSIRNMAKGLNIPVSELVNHKFFVRIASEDVQKAFEYGVEDFYMEFEDMEYYMNEPLMDYIRSVSPISEEELSNLKQMISIIENSQLKYSKDYRADLMEDFAIKMYKTIGLEGMRELLRIRELSKEEVESYFKEDEEKYKEYFNRNCEVQGNVGIAIQIINGLEKSQIFTTKERLEFYKQLNAKIQDTSSRETLRSIETIVESIKPGSGEKVRELSQRMNEKTIKGNLAPSEVELIARFNHIFAGLPRQSEFVYHKVKDLMVAFYREDGKIDLEGIESELKEAFGSENVGHVIGDKKAEIIANFLEYFETHKKEINRSVLDVMKVTSDEVGKGYIRKLLMIQSPRMTKEELEEWIAKVNNPNFTKERLKYKETIEVKAGKEKEVYQALDKQNLRMQGVVTYNQIEAMFGGMKEPYSQEFIKYWQKHKEEILSSSEYYSRLSQIHNAYDTLLADPKNVKVEDWSVEALLQKVEAMPFAWQRPGDEELAEIALSAQAKGFEASDFGRAEELFDRMREREEASIPPVISEIHGKYRGRMLRPDDPLAIFVGTLTDCCQELNNAGEECMVHSVTDKHGGVFVVEEVDERGEVKRLVAQSWVWRNKGRLCFDNIEQEEEHFEEIASAEESEAVLATYREAAERALAIDEEFFETLESEGKISSEQRRKYQLQEVTIGMGYNAQAELRRLVKEGKLKRAEDIAPEGYSGYRDSNSSYIIAENTRISRENGEIKNITNREQPLLEMPYWYGKRDEVQILNKKILSSNEYEEDYDDEDYDGEDYYEEDDTNDDNGTGETSKKNRAVEVNPINGKIEQIKAIEREAFAEEEHHLQQVNDSGDLEKQYDFETEQMNIAINREGSFYIVFEERESEIYIAEMARKPKDKLAELEMQETIYKMIMHAKEKGKAINVAADRDASQIAWQRFSELSEEDRKKELERVHKDTEKAQKRRIIRDER